MRHKIGRATAMAVLLLAAVACSTKPQSLEGMKAPTLESSKLQPLDVCPASKCLTVYVAPWCPHCRASTPMILGLRQYLQTRDVATRIIVGMDKDQAVRSYAAVFGSDTFLDPEGRIGPHGGVPAFMISDRQGRVLEVRNGSPEVQPPFTQEMLEKIAALYGLP